MEIHLTKEVEEFIAKLEGPTIAKVLRTIDLLERFGSQLQLPHSQPIGQGLFELRIHGHQEIRIFYGYHQKGAVLLHGFIKKSRQIPQKEIKAAQGKFRTIIGLT